MATVYSGLGSNLGDREANITQALARLGQRVGVEQTSSLYETEPVGCEEGGWFLNAVCVCSTQFDPFEVLSLAKEIEGELGREPIPLRRTNAPRPIDIDILFYDDVMLETPDLVIPHPRICTRAFVLVPMSEIAPGFIHPVEKRTISDLLGDLKDSHKIRKWCDVSDISSAAL